MKLYQNTLFLTLLPKLQAHGGLSFPPSRQWLCSGGASPKLGVGWNGHNGPNICQPEAHKNWNELNTAIVNWSGINQGDADGRIGNENSKYPYDEDPRKAHVQVMGGESSPVCSGGFSNIRYSGLDNPMFTRNLGGFPEDFPIQEYPTIIPNGKHKFTYTVTAPHRTFGSGYTDIYITKDNIDFSNMNKVLTWKDLEKTPFCHYINPNPNTPMQVGGGDPFNTEVFECEIPEMKVGKHVLFTVWQRSDSPEAFYSCSDVVLVESDGAVEDGSDDHMPDIDGNIIYKDEKGDKNEPSFRSLTLDGQIHLKSNQMFESEEHDNLCVERDWTNRHSPIFLGSCFSQADLTNKNKTSNRPQSPLLWSITGYGSISNGGVNYYANMTTKQCWTVQNVWPKGGTKKLFHDIKMEKCHGIDQFNNSWNQKFKFDQETGFIKYSFDDRFCVNFSYNSLRKETSLKRLFLGISLCESLYGTNHNLIFGVACDRNERRCDPIGWVGAV